MAEFVRLISSDQVEFGLELEIAELSHTLKTFLDPRYPFKESSTREVSLPVRAAVLRRIIEFMRYKHAVMHNVEVDEFVVADEETMDLLDVASYLRI